MGYSTEGDAIQSPSPKQKYKNNPKRKRQTMKVSAKALKANSAGVKRK